MQNYVEALQDSNITFHFGQPITWKSIEDNLDAWVELYNAYPAVIVVDNLMDVEGCEADYKLQTLAMQDLASLARATGSTVIVLHHASESGVVEPGLPPARSAVLNKLSQKPELMLGVSLATRIGCELRVAVTKQRDGRSDESAQNYIRLKAIPEHTRFEPGPAEWNTSH